MSRNNKDIDDYLQNRMAKQLGVSTNVFRDIVDCSVSRSDYIEQVNLSEHEQNDEPHSTALGRKDLPGNSLSSNLFAAASHLLAAVHKLEIITLGPPFPT